MMAVTSTDYKAGRLPYDKFHSIKCLFGLHQISIDGFVL